MNRSRSSSRNRTMRPFLTNVIFRSETQCLSVQTLMPSRSAASSDFSQRCRVESIDDPASWSAALTSPTGQHFVWLHVCLGAACLVTHHWRARPDMSHCAIPQDAPTATAMNSSPQYDVNNGCETVSQRVIWHLTCSNAVSTGMSHRLLHGRVRFIKPESRNEKYEPLPMITKSRKLTPSISAPFSIRRTRLMSSGLGFGTPDG